MRIFLLIAIICLFISACQQSPRKNYFLLSAPEVARNGTAENIDKVIGIGPIEIAEYLNRLHIAYQAEDGSLVMAENDYWAEPLSKGIPRVLGLNLTRRDPSRSFVNFPWRNDSQPDYSLRLQIHSLDRAGNQAAINATWELIDNTEKTNILRRHFIRTTTATSGAQGLSKAYSQLLSELAREMDEALANLPSSD